jgi:hypothetical protein
VREIFGHSSPIVTFDVDSRLRPDDLDGDSPPSTQDSLDAQIPADAALRQRQAASSPRTAVRSCESSVFQMRVNPRPMPPWC